MTEKPDQPMPPRPPGPRRLSGLVLWLFLVPLVFGTLTLFSNLALFINLDQFAADTRSLLQATYEPWPYGQIPPINIAAFFQDVQREIEQFGTPNPAATVEEGAFWIPPTATNEPAGQRTITPTPVAQAPSKTPTEAPNPNTATPSSPTKTNTPVPPTATLVFTSSATASKTVIYKPTDTFTSEPRRATKTPVPPPTSTFTEVPTETATEPYAPVHPIAENNGTSSVDPGGQGCVGYFGYRNDNPTEVDIPAGDYNHLSPAPGQITPELTTHFYTDRVSPAFEVIWNTPGPITWFLNGREATLQWCNP